MRVLHAGFGGFRGFILFRNSVDKFYLFAIVEDLACCDGESYAPSRRDGNTSSSLSMTMPV
jgi:hypothetical protein